MTSLGRSNSDSGFLGDCCCRGRLPGPPPPPGIGLPGGHGLASSRRGADDDAQSRWGKARLLFSIEIARKKRSSRTKISLSPSAGQADDRGGRSWVGAGGPGTSPTTGAVEWWVTQPPVGSATTCCRVDWARKPAAMHAGPRARAFGGPPRCLWSAIELSVVVPATTPQPALRSSVFCAAGGTLAPPVCSPAPGRLDSRGLPGRGEGMDGLRRSVRRRKATPNTPGPQDSRTSTQHTTQQQLAV